MKCIERPSGIGAGWILRVERKAKMPTRRSRHREFFYRRFSQIFADGRLKSLAAKRRTMHKRELIFTGDSSTEGNEGYEGLKFFTAGARRFSQMQMTEGSHVGKDWGTELRQKDGGQKHENSGQTHKENLSAETGGGRDFLLLIDRRKRR